MAQNIIDSIRSVVEKHYSESAEVLLLADLGKILRANGSWLPADDQRPLGSFVEEMAPEIILIRDPDAAAFVTVVPADKKQLALEAIERRHKTHLLSRLPRPILLAFCLKADNQAVYVRTTPPYRYQFGESPETGFAAVEEHFRLPGLYVGDPRALSPADALALVEKVEGWAKQHNFSLDKFRMDRGSNSPTPAQVVPQPKRDTNALERLYAAQPSSLAAQMVMPFDIAVYLSRLP
jgi:hypothetical protein